MVKTYDDFLIAVKQQYDEAKNGKYSSFLLHPSPAQLRNLCLLLLENNLSKSDEEIFSVFFQVTEGKDLKRSIENFDIENVVARGSDRTVSRAYSIHAQVSIRIFACTVSRPAGLGARPDNNMHHVFQVSLGRSPSRLMKFGL